MCGTRRRTSRRRRGILGHHHLGHHGVVPVVVDEVEEEPPVTTGVYCFSCNFTSNPEGAKYCQNCGDKLYICPISQMSFKVGDEFSQCPKCKTVFHKHHLDISLASNSNCPYCQNPLAGVYVGKVGTHAVDVY